MDQNNGNGATPIDFNEGKPVDDPLAPSAAPVDDPLASSPPPAPKVPRDPTNVFKLHPLAEIFPPMTDDEYDIFFEDVNRVGKIRTPIVLLDGMILDGRHRYRAVDDAWDKLGKEIKFETRDFDPEVDGDPIEFVHSANFARRSLNTTQKAMIGVQYRDKFAEATIKGRPKKGEREEKLGEARERAARLAGVSAKTISTAVKIRDEAPKLYEEMASGTTTVFQAAKELAKVQEQKDHNASSGTQRTPSPHERFPWRTQRVSEILMHEYPDDVQCGVWITENVQDNGTVIFNVLVETMEADVRSEDFDIATNLNDAKRAAIKTYHKLNGRSQEDVDQAAKDAASAADPQPQAPKQIAAEI